MLQAPIGDLASSSVVRRHPANPILTSADEPCASTLVFNPGVTKYEGRYVMAFRNDYGREGDTHFGTNIGLAWGDDGVQWEVTPEPWIELKDDEIRRAYDPRPTVIDGRGYGDLPDYGGCRGSGAPMYHVDGLEGGSLESEPGAGQESG